MFTSLCLGGGGVCGFAHVGFLKCLHEKGMLNDITMVVGTSIGSLVGMLFSIGLVVDEILSSLLKLNQSFLQSNAVESILNSYGVDSGEYFVAFLIDVLIKNGVDPRITFGKIRTQYGKELVITGTDISRHSSVYYCSRDNPDMRVIQAVRISVAFPFLLSAVRIDEALLVDGGVMDNYPLNYTLKNTGEGEVIGCYLNSTDQLRPTPIQTLEDYIYNMVACAIKSQDHQVLSCEANNTVVVRCPFHSMQFDLNESDKLSLVQLGYIATKDHFASKIKSVKSVSAPALPDRSQGDSASHPT